MNILEAAKLVEARKTFKCGNVVGASFLQFGTGQMSRADMMDLIVDVDATDFYVVYSYVTPIAWFADGKWNVPDAGYSPTTKRQKTRLKLYALSPR